VPEYKPREQQSSPVSKKGKKGKSGRDRATKKEGEASGEGGGRL
jgi:hypothetical protein